MHNNSLKAMIKLAVRGAAVLLFGVGAAGAQQTINLSAGPASASLPDGSSVPMWGYSCGAAVVGATATCAPLNANANGGWSPVVITVPTGQALTINLKNNLIFTAGTGTNSVPTSLMIVGQIGGGLGDASKRTTDPSPNHNLVPQGVTWPTANTGATFTAPAQADRVRSFGTEVAAGATTALTWGGTGNPPLRPGTYLIESGTHPSIQGTMGLYGILVVTTAPAGTTAGQAYPAVGSNPAVTYKSEVPLLLGEIDPVQNTAVSKAVGTVGFSETMVWSGQPGGCGNSSSATYLQCYPPVVNYTPLYYTINGVAFSRANSGASLFASSIGTSTAPVTGNVLVRIVNAGSHMHVPSIVGSTTGTPAKNGFALVAEDGNPVTFVPHVQSEVFMAAGKTFDVMINAPPAGGTALPIYDRELSLSANKINRDAGMLAYIGVNGATLPVAPALGAAKANADSYNAVIAGQTLTVSDPSKGVIANDVNVFGVKVITTPTKGTVTLNEDGTFTYAANSTWTAPDTFVYCGNGTTTGAACATVTLGAESVESATGITCASSAFTSKLATFIKIPNPALVAACTDAAGYPLTVVTSSITPASGLKVVADPAGGFTGSISTSGYPGGTYSFTYLVKNSQGTTSGATATATITFPAGSGLAVNVVDGKTGAAASSGDYRWIIEEDRSFYINPNCTQNVPAGAVPPGCTATQLPGGTVPILGTNFHTSDMPFVAQGCTGPLSCEFGQTSLGSPVVCDVGNGVCRPDSTLSGKTAVLPGAVSLDPTKRYYISVLPGDAANPFISGNGGATCGTYTTSQKQTASTCGYSMGGAPVAPGQTAVTVQVEQDPFPPSKLSVDVFEDDFPLNGEQDSGGGVDVLSPQEPGLGGFNIVLWDDMGGSGDVTGQMTYDMFNQPLSNSLDGTIDPVTTLNACPITKAGTAAGLNAPGITGMIVTCPKYESDGITLSPLAGQAVVANLMPGRFSVQAIPGADRIARGENWLQTNTLDGQKAHDSFLRIGEPAYFQEFGPAGYHVNIGFANPGIINGRKAGVCNGSDVNITNLAGCPNTITGKITTERMSRTPDERLYSSGSHDSFAFSQCYISVGDPDGEDFAFTYCNADGTFTVAGLPPGNWRVTVFDEWNDMIVDGLSTPVGLADPTKLATGAKQPCPGPTTTSTLCDMGDIASSQWQANVYTRTFIDDNKNGVYDTLPAAETGIPFLSVAVRYRDGSLANGLVTDLNGVANFNETFPLFNWYVVETDVTRYKTTGIHTVYDAGGPADNSLLSCYSPSTLKPGATVPTNSGAGYPNCGTTAIGSNMANTVEPVPLPSNLSVPGAIYCPTADCTGMSIQNGASPSAPGVSTGRIDPGWVAAEGWQGYSGLNNFIEFGKAPYIPGETGGIHGHVIYASTRPFDDPMMLVQTQWEPLVPHVTINLYQEGLAGDGITKTLKLVDTTQTSSFDDWAQGFRTDGMPNMNCPGQSTGDLFYFSLLNQPNYLDWYNKQHATAGALNTAAVPTALPSGSQFKCYDGMHNWNQLEPAPYDGMYSFPSVTGRNPATGNTTGTNCTICVKNPDPNDAFRFGKEDMLPAGKYVVEVVPPAGYEIVKEEDKNILIGDNFIAPVTQQFGGLGDIFILPDQASVASQQQYPGAGYNPNNPQNPTQSLGASPNNGIVPGFVPEPTWPCVGDARIVPDFISLFPQSQQVAPFAGATRNLCDRKEVTLNDQTGATAKFYIYTSTHKAAKYTGVITDDFTSEFDPFSPQFGEKFAPPNMPISVKDWTGTEISRVYSDWWGDYDGMTYSTWEVNPPNPTGYSPTMMVFCMNDKGPIPSANGPITDPLFNPSYSQFCYELPYMPGQTQYLDTPVVPTSAFSAGYNHPDCSYPDSTPSISSVTSTDIAGPWVSAAGHFLTINALPDQQIPNNGYVGPSATTAPYNQKTVNRHFGFGSTAGKVTIGGVIATATKWSDTQLTVRVPTGIPNCAIQQEAQYGGSTAQCGELAITNANGQQSIDTVTITVGGKTPTLLTGSAPGTVTGPGSIQQAIDSAMPGDMIIVPPGTYKEMLIMWKPVRLQGVGAASSVIDANAQPAGKLDPWRRQVACLFGIAINGRPIDNNPGSPTYNPFDNPADTANGGGPYTCNTTTATDPLNQNFMVDRLPLEATVGWDATLNGNLAEMLQEPTLMGAYEGAGITVLGKGVKFPAGSSPFGSDTYPTGTLLLTSSDCRTSSTNATNPYPGNFMCNPSAIDGLAITDASQGGGGIFVHGFNHNIQIANNRVYSNIGTLSGGINIGQGEFPPQYLQNGTSNADPGSCAGTLGLNLATNEEQPYCFNLNVNVHHNNVTKNTSIGDELFSGTLAGAGGVSFCTGSDYYKFNYNWICGNMSSGDGGGVAHLGFSFNGDIEHNSILFNQSLNPTIPTNGGGLMIEGTPDSDPVCGLAADADCPPGMSDGVGPNLVINANLIQGNAAEAGSGGGLRLQGVNGTEVTNFPGDNTKWYAPKITNNIIVNNVAGWDGGGVSFEDALATQFINNTVASNDSTATAGVLFNTLGAPLASSQTPGTPTTGPSGTTSAPQPAGLVTMQNSTPLTAALNALPAGTAINCPVNSPNCTIYSNPYLMNNIFWQNRSFYVGVGATSAKYQQNLVTLYNLDGSLPGQQTTTGACPTANNYWDIGVRGDTGPGNHSMHGALPMQLAPNFSLLTNTAEAGAGSNNLMGANPNVAAQYCNGSRVPPEYAAGTFNVPPGIADASVPNPLFTLQATATVDEGNNWVNLAWGPLSLTNPTTTGTNGNPGSGSALGNYVPTVNSPTNAWIPVNSAGGKVAPSTDFFGNVRPDPSNPGIDIGAVEFQGAVVPPTITSVAPNSGYRGTSVPVTITGTNLASTQTVTFNGTGLTATVNSVSATSVTATVAVAPNAGLGIHYMVVYTGSGAIAFSNAFTVLGPSLSSISPAIGFRGQTVPVTITGVDLTGATTVNVSGTGVVCTVTGTPTATTVTASCAIASNATTTSRNVSVTGPNGTTGNVSLTVSAPALTSISPALVFHGQTVTVTLNGTDLTGATAVNVSGAGVTCTAPSVSSGVLATTSCTVSQTAGTTNRNLTVVTPNGTTNSQTLAVQGATLTSIAPVSGSRGATVPVTLTGTLLTGATQINVAASGITCSISGTATATTVPANCSIPYTEAIGQRNVTVVTPQGTTNVAAFRVLTGGATFTAPSPSLQSTPANTSTKTGTITITNIAPLNNPNAGPITLTSAPTIAKVGTVGGTFSITGGTCVSGFVINPGGGTCTITVQYVPGTSTATGNARITISDTGTTTPTLTPTFAAN